MNDLDYSLYYGRFHPDSEAHTEVMAKHMVAELEPLLPLDRHGPVLDIGCGYGFAMLALRKLGFESVQGVEVSSQQADRARRNGLDVDVIDDPSKWLAQRSTNFSAVLLLDVLEHLPIGEQVPLLRSIYRCLTPGGRVIIQVPNANAILAVRWRYSDFTHCSSFTEHSLYFVLKNAGFDDIQIGAEKGIGRFPKRLWRRNARIALRKYLVRWCWLQVFKAELPWERLDDISFDFNLKAVAFRRG
jgi:SAM-dependent methyltransferase